MKKIYVSGFYWSNGGGEYTIPVYHAAEVDKELKKAYREGYREGTVASNDLIEELRKENGDLHVRFEAMSELIAELDAIVLLLEWVMDESEDWILSGEDLMRINEAIKKVRG